MLKPLILAGTLLLGACAAGGDSSAEEARLMETSRDWSAAMQSRNLERIMEYYTDDAVILSPGEPERRGKAAIRDHLQASFEVPGFSVRWTPLHAQVASSGDIGVLVERTEVSVTGPQGEKVSQNYRTVTVWRKSAGRWRNSLDISNSASRPTL